MRNNKRRLKREDKELMINIFNELTTSIRCTENILIGLLNIIMALFKINEKYLK